MSGSRISVSSLLFVRARLQSCQRMSAIHPALAAEGRILPRSGELGARQSESGVVLVVVLWGIVLMALLAFALSTAVRTAVQGIEAQQERLQGYYYARGAVNQSLALLLSPPSSSTGPADRPVPGDRLVWQEGPWRTQVALEDEAGKIDLNQAPKKVLVRLFTALGQSSEAAESLADATEQWRTPSGDEVASMYGGRDSYYLHLPLPYLPPHADFRSVAEMLLVRGVTPELYYGRYVVHSDGRIEHRLGLLDCLTVHSRAPQIDINTAPIPVLLAVPSMAPDLAGYIVKTRAEKPFTSIQQLNDAPATPLGPEALSYLCAPCSGPLSLRATARNTDGVTARLRVVIEFPQGVETYQNGHAFFTAPARPFQILRWDDNDDR